MNKTITAIVASFVLGTGVGIAVGIRGDLNAEQDTVKPSHAEQMGVSQYKRLLESLPNYADPSMLDGDALGNVYVNEEKLLKDLREKYQKALTCR